MLIHHARMMRAGVLVSALVVGVSLPSIAFAQEATPDGAPPATSPPPGAAEPMTTTPGADKPAESAKPHEEGEERWRASLDAVFGFGATPVVSQRIVGPLITQESRTAETARYTTSSFNLELSREMMRDFRVGVLLPVGFGSVYSQATRGSTVVGNVTLGAEFEHRMNKALALSAGLDVALPTASGEELPPSSTLATSGHVDQKQFDRFSLLKAMSDSRGREDTASFASQHLGLVPKVGLTYTGMEKLELSSYLKYESLHGTAGDASYEGAIVFVVRGSYHFSKKVDATLRAWTNVPVAGQDTAVVIAEPQLSGHFGALTPIVGVVLPVAGELTDPYNIGVRVALAARF